MTHEIMQLEAENAFLRGQNDELYKARDKWDAELASLKAEVDALKQEALDLQGSNNRLLIEVCLLRAHNAMREEKQ